MEIVTYEEVDPYDVLDLNLLCFNFALTPELVDTIRRLDRRPFPFFALYALKENLVVGQVGVFRVPLITVDGPVEAGAVWAMCTHPAYFRQGIGSQLLDEAHSKMRAAGLPFSTLGTSRHWVSHPFYRQHGYLDLATFTSALASRQNLPKDARNRLAIRKADMDDLDQTDELFRLSATEKTGFSRRYEPFMRMMIEVGDILSLEQLRLIYEGYELVGYAAVNETPWVLSVNNFLLLDRIHVVDAAAALLHDSGAQYVRMVTNNHSPLVLDLKRAGFRVTSSTLDVTMIKSLSVKSSLNDYQRLFDLDGGRFMMSGFDVT